VRKAAVVGEHFAGHDDQVDLVAPESLDVVARWRRDLEPDAGGLGGQPGQQGGEQLSLASVELIADCPMFS